MIRRGNSNQDNFSYRIIDTSIYKFVPVEQQMISYQNIDIEDTGELDIEGEVIIIV